MTDDAIAEIIHRHVTAAVAEVLAQQREPVSLEPQAIPTGTFFAPTGFPPPLPAEPAKPMPTAAPAAPAPAPVAPTPAPKPPSAPAPAPASNGRRLHTVVASAVHGAGTRAEYWTFTVQDEAGNKALLKFYRSSITLAQDWNEVLALFIQSCGVQRLTTGEELHEKQLNLTMSIQSNQTIAGIEAMKAALE